MGGLPVEAWFDDFSVEPLASASIAQVHTARLKENGKEVVIKVIRPDILPIIKADMKLIYRLARWVPRLLPDGRRLRPQEVVREYEKTLLDELNLLRESANAIQLRRNFEDSPMLYVPEVYPDYCSESMMVMERIYGIPVSDVEALEAQGPTCSCWRSGACRSSSPRCSATASSMPICTLATYSSATSTRKIRSISASTAVLSAR
jgi:ubiquinone biosynthesis protein